MRERVFRLAAPAAALVVALVPATVCHADELPAPVDPSTFIVGSSTCPQPQNVWIELGTLVPHDRLAQRVAANPVPLPAVQIIDLGIPYRVIAAGRVREYRDDVRDCAHRARVAALFIALTFDPPVVVEKPAPPPPQSVAVAPAPPPASDPIGHRARLDVGGAGEAGWGSAADILQAGLGLRLAIGQGVWALVVGAVALLPTDITVNDLRMRHWRLPADVGVRALWRGGTVAPYCEAGLGAAVLVDRALDLAGTDGATAVEWGGFTALGIRFTPSDRFAPFIAARAELVPNPPAIHALPRGLIGHTPSVWLGVSAGVSIDF